MQSRFIQTPSIHCQKKAEIIAQEKNIDIQNVLAGNIQAIKAVGPLSVNDVTCGQLFAPQCELTDPNLDMLCEYGVRILVST
jgi:hypothetical protein